MQFKWPEHMRVSIFYSILYILYFNTSVTDSSENLKNVSRLQWLQKYRTEMEYLSVLSSVKPALEILLEIIIYYSIKEHYSNKIYSMKEI